MIYLISADQSQDSGDEEEDRAIEEGSRVTQVMVTAAGHHSRRLSAGVLPLPKANSLRVTGVSPNIALWMVIIRQIFDAVSRPSRRVTCEGVAVKLTTRLQASSSCHVWRGAVEALFARDLLHKEEAYSKSLLNAFHIYDLNIF